jgi:hypothetical protein
MSTIILLILLIQQDWLFGFAVGKVAWVSGIMRICGMTVKTHHLDPAVDGQVLVVVDHLGVEEEIRLLMRVPRQILAERLQGVKGKNNL